MDKNVANELLKEINESWQFVNQELLALQGPCPEEQLRDCKMLLARVMSDMFDTVMAPIYDEHEDLAPEWYRGGTPVGGPEVPEIEAPPEVRRALLAAFEAAYEKVQSTLERVSRLPDPVEAARFSLSIHYISVTLCRARMALLLAEVE